MSPITHFLAGWLIAERIGVSRKERLCITGAGIASDLDGLGMVADVINDSMRGIETNWYARWHHVLGHGIFGFTLCMLACWAFRCRGLRVFFGVALSFHLHLLFDLVGSRGPTAADIWPIYYWGPFSRDHAMYWLGQWPLNGWQNFFVTVVLIAYSVVVALRRGHSPVWLFSPHLDSIVVATLRSRLLRRT